MASNNFNFGQNASALEISRQFPFSEPFIIQTVHVDGIVARAGADLVNLIGWQTVEPLSEGAGERRIVTRSCMTETEARVFHFALGWALRRGH